MKKIYLVCVFTPLIVFFSACNDGARPDQPNTQIIDGPLKGKNAVWDKGIKAFIVEGDISKAKPLVKCIPRACTGGVPFRQCPTEQPEFQNIFLGQSKKPLFENSSMEHFPQGFSFISGDIESLNGRKPKIDGRARWVIIFHPKLINAAKELFRVIDQNDWNQFETGILLGYSEVDSYAWVFGTDDAKKYYPNEKFIKENEGYSKSKSLPWRKIGKNRLKNIIPADEYEYVVAEYSPTGDKVYESSNIDQ